MGGNPPGFHKGPRRAFEVARDAPGARRAIANAFARWRVTDSDCMAYSARSSAGSLVRRPTAWAKPASTRRASAPKPPSASTTKGDERQRRCVTQRCGIEV